MLREFEWRKSAEHGLLEWGLQPFEVEEAVCLSHHGRSENDGPADWTIRRGLPEGRGTLFVRYDWPTAREDEARARLVSLWVNK
jgi:hypothetical protein